MDCDFLLLWRISGLLISFPCSPAGIKRSRMKCSQGSIRERFLLEGSGHSKRSGQRLLLDGPLAHWTKIFFIFASMTGGVLRML
jgi:hypothetical protein